MQGLSMPLHTCFISRSDTLALQKVLKFTRYLDRQVFRRW